MSRAPQSKGSGAPSGREYLPEEQSSPLTASLPASMASDAPPDGVESSTLLDGSHRESLIQSRFAVARAKLRLVEAALCLCAVAVIWVGASVLVQQLFFDLKVRLPFFLTYICVSEFIILLPFRYAKEKWLRKGFSIGWFSLAPTEPTDWKAAAKAAATVCPIWFAAQSTYNASLGGTTVSASTVLSTTSCVWTFTLSVLFLGERFDWRRLGGVVLTLCGAALVSYSNVAEPQSSGGSQPERTWWGDALALTSALCYGLYTTAIRRLVPDGGPISLSVFFGFLGLFNSVMLMPVVIGLALSGVEEVRKVTASFIGWVLLKGLLDNVISDLIWGHAIVISSATMATVGLALTIPFAMIAEVIFHSTLPSPSLAGGSVLVIAGFIITTVFSSVSGAANPPRGHAALAADEDGGEDGDLESKAADVLRAPPNAASATATPAPSSGTSFSKSAAEPASATVMTKPLFTAKANVASLRRAEELRPLTAPSATAAAAVDASSVLPATGGSSGAAEPGFPSNHDRT